MICHKLHNRFLGNHLARNTNTLAEVHQVWRSEQAHLIALRLQCSRDEMRSRTLAIGASYMHRTQAFVRIAQMRHEAIGIV